MSNWTSKLQSIVSKYIPSSKNNTNGNEDIHHYNDLADYFAEILVFIQKSSHINSNIPLLHKELQQLYNITTLSDGSVREGYHSVYASFSKIILSAHSLLSNHQINKRIYTALIEFALEFSNELKRINSKGISITDTSNKVESTDSELEMLNNELNQLRLVKNQKNREEELRNLYTQYSHNNSFEQLNMPKEDFNSEHSFNSKSDDVEGLIKESKEIIENINSLLYDKENVQNISNTDIQETNNKIQEFPIEYIENSMESNEDVFSTALKSYTRPHRTSEVFDSCNFQLPSESTFKKPLNVIQKDEDEM